MNSPDGRLGEQGFLIAWIVLQAKLMVNTVVTHLVAERGRAWAPLRSAL